MSTSAMLSKKLPSGALIPSIGLGVYQSQPGNETYQAVLTALQYGYRHIDTAKAYSNERDVGRAIRDSGVPREQIFVTSKIYTMTWGSYNHVVAAVRESNEKLGLGYIDLYLLHSPSASKGRADAWRALEDLQSEGILRDIGVSNFGEAHLKKLAETWRVKPAVNQIELHPWLAREDTVKYCESQGIFLEAYSPLARAMKLHDPVLVQVATEVGGTPAQVLVAWSLAKGFIALPKSVKTARIKENFDGWNIQLSVSQMEKLNKLDEYFLSCIWDPITEHEV
uniref:NADP-dependent oxidoreductase domain-containing protein n=1 Tax=Globisporangium ultimum (strain ATCC 200006 / CBS 805.95 / DAOM BR144) TaxID=431595 RepID=K3WD18_GLOUD